MWTNSNFPNSSFPALFLEKVSVADENETGENKKNMNENIKTKITIFL